MEKLNELAYRAERYLLTKSESQPEQINVSCKTVLAIAEAFREMEKEVQKNLEGAFAWQNRAEAAEEKLSALQDGFVEVIRTKTGWPMS